jgi:glutathione S-transferase
MIELLQLPWSPYCLVQKRILEFSGGAHKVINVSVTDRSLIWRLTKRRYYQVPVVKDGRQVLFETDENSQVIAKYLDAKLGLGLFPPQWEGLQYMLWRFIENDLEGVGFKLNDIYYREFVPIAEQLGHIRHKERKFGRGCLEQWRAKQKQLVREFVALLVPFEQMLATRMFLLDGQPRFVDFDLWGILANFFYTGHYRFPAVHPKLSLWYRRMSQIKSASR